MIKEQFIYSSPKFHMSSEISASAAFVEKTTQNHQCWE